MFGAINRFIARLDTDPPPPASHAGPNDSSYGFQVLRNTDAGLPIEPWFDFIVGINGHVIDEPDPRLFATEVSNCAGSSLSLAIWSAKGQRAHTLTVAVPPAPQPLGLTLQLAPLHSTQNIWHILSIPSPLSPAYLAGLLPQSDYILGTPSGTLRGEAALGELVEDHLNRSLVLWVYNSEFDVVREVELIPRRGWGGEGALGAVLGFGALHRLPLGLGEEIQGPGEKMFEAEERVGAEKASTGETSNFMMPAESRVSIEQRLPPFLGPSAVSPPGITPNGRSGTPGHAKTTGKKPRHRGGAPPNRAFDDIFEEGAKKSQEQDFVPSKKGSQVAPPPKLGGLEGSSIASTQQIPLNADNMLAAVEDVGEPGEVETI